MNAGLFESLLLRHRKALKSLDFKAFLFCFDPVGIFGFKCMRRFADPSQRGGGIVDAEEAFLVDGDGRQGGSTAASGRTKRVFCCRRPGFVV